MAYLSRDCIRIAAAYADIFDFPLTDDELFRWVPFVSPSRLDARAVRGLTKTGQYWHLQGRDSIVRIRQRRARASVRQWRRAKSAGRIIGRIPTVRFAGISGSLAMNNAEEASDIDVFIICQNGTTWTTRLLVTLAMETVGIRRKPEDRYVAGKICLNMFTDTEHLEIPRKKQNLFSAHEVLQLVPLVDIAGTHAMFLRANSWTRVYLPNAWHHTVGNIMHTTNRFTHPMRTALGLAFQICEPALRILQMQYMQRRRTTEEIGKGSIRFHPADASGETRKALFVRLRTLGIPLDKKIWSGYNSTHFNRLPKFT